MPRLTRFLAPASGVALLAVLGVAAPAPAAVTATLSGTALTLTGDAGDDTVAVGSTGPAGVTVSVPGIALPAGAGALCSVLPGVMSCPGVSTVTVDGGAGDDVLSDLRAPGASGVLTLLGGPGQDTLREGPGTDVLSGGDGFDEVVADRTGMTISLDDVADDGPTGAGERDDVRSDVEDVTTGDGADVVRGSASPNVIQTGGGNDLVDPGAGADTVALGAGDDALFSLDGQADTADGGGGTDVVTADLPGEDPGSADVLRLFETVGGTPLPRRWTLGELTFTGAPDVPAVVGLDSLTVPVAKVLKSGRVPIGVTTNEPASVAGLIVAPGKLRAVGDLVIASSQLGTGSGRRILTLRLAPDVLAGYRSRLRTKAQRTKGLTLTLRVVAIDAGGLVTTVTSKLRIKG